MRIVCKAINVAVSLDIRIIQCYNPLCFRLNRVHDLCDSVLNVATFALENCIDQNPDHENDNSRQYCAPAKISGS